MELEAFERQVRPTLFALFFFGGEVIRGFTFAMIWGVVVGTYSSIFIAAPALIFLGVHRGARATSTKKYENAERIDAKEPDGAKAVTDEAATDSKGKA